MNTLQEHPARTLLYAEAQRPGSANILYVENDATLRHLSTLTLTRTGYAVTSAEGGLQAWGALHSSSYDLLITDNEMPQFMASRSANVLGGLDYEGPHFAAQLQKPFASGQLVEVVRQVLATASTTRRTSSTEIAEALRRITPYPHWGLNE